MDRPAAGHPLVAGVCSRLASFFRCNAWALRAVFVLLLLVKTLWALVVYGGLALMFRLVDHYCGANPASGKDFSLKSPQFAAHNRRIRELDRRFRDWEDSERQ